MLLRTSVAIIVMLIGASASLAQERWHVTLLEGGSFPVQIVNESRQIVLKGLPDGLIETSDGESDIQSAWYAGPTDRYGHGILGDAIEASILKVRTAAGKLLSFQLPGTEVFEDRYPRLADLDGDGKTEVVTIRSLTSLGASVTVYGVLNNALVQRASNGFIGLSNRWLNIAGIANFRGGKSKEIAYVRTPHIGGTLFVYRFLNGEMLPVGSLDGFSNHLIRSGEMRLSAIADINGYGRADLALPSKVAACYLFTARNRSAYAAGGLSTLMSRTLEAGSH